MSYESYEPRSWEVLCSDEAMEVFAKLCGSRDPSKELEIMLDKLLLGKKSGADFDDCVAALVAAALVAYSETDINAYNLLDLDLEDSDDNAVFEKQYEPFLDVIYHTDLSRLCGKAVKVLNKMHGTELGEWWYEDDSSIEWLENIVGMKRALELNALSEKLKKKRASAGIESYQVLCGKDGMNTFLELSRGENIAKDIESRLDGVSSGCDHHVCTAGLVAAALVAYSETEKINCYNLLDLDLDIPEDKERFYKEFDPFLDKVYKTNLSHLKKKAFMVLQMMYDSKLGDLWKAYDENWSNWSGNIDEMLEELEKC